MWDVLGVSHASSQHAFQNHNSRTPEELQADMMKHYAGHFVIGRDLDVY
jgi:hypothetical protein